MINESQKSEAELLALYKRAAKWLMSRSVGLSSQAILAHILGIETEYGKITPSDSSDFSRCYNLLRTIPELKNELDVMRGVSPAWNRLIDNWGELTQLLEMREYENLNNRLDQLTTI